MFLKTTSVHNFMPPPLLKILDPPLLVSLLFLPYYYKVASENADGVAVSVENLHFEQKKQNIMHQLFIHVGQCNGYAYRHLFLSPPSSRSHSPSHLPLLPNFLHHLPIFLFPTFFTTSLLPPPFYPLHLPHLSP